MVHTDGPRAGSPPQVRGKLPCCAVGIYGRRITPAGAGKTRVVVRICRHGEDHPRRCGENLIPQQKKQKPIGSPPQVRGKPLARGGCGCCFGITPAGAGKTSPIKTFKELSKDHPRRCGENPYCVWNAFALSGSPPQVRGKRSVRVKTTDSTRITPAGAGKTLPSSVRIRIP